MVSMVSSLVKINVQFLQWQITSIFILTWKSLHVYRVFSHDVMVAILVSHNNKTAAMLVSQTNPVGVELFSYANAFFCPINLHRCWPGEWKHSICSTYEFDPEAKTIILSCTFSPLCQLFGFFCKRISHVLQLLVEFVHFIFAYATFSRFPSGAFQGLLRQKRGTLFECHCI